jgi:predicted phosphodiesterase
MIYLTGDTHTPIHIHKLNSKNFPEGKNLTKNDYVIICGDFGLIWTKENKEEIYWKKWLDNKPWTTLFVDGNHENHKRLQELPLVNKFNSIVGKVSDSIFHLRRGEVYTIDNKTFFCLGGARSTDKENRIIDVSWWKEEELSYSEINYALDNLEKVQWNVDYVITHTAPNEIISKIYNPREDSVTNLLDHIKENLNFKRWYFGHLHQDKDLDNFHALFNIIKKID